MQKGIYILIIYLNKGSEIKIGKLGTFLLKKGYYIYVGSALNNLQKRVERHLSSHKKLHWHIDYLLCYAKIMNVYVFKTLNKDECNLSKEIALLPESQTIIDGFGSSDCTCKTHLYFFKKRPAFKTNIPNSHSSLILHKIKDY